MSCIPKLLKMKGDKEDFRLTPDVILESGGNYKGYDFCVTFTSLGHRCGYVAIPSSHKYTDRDKAESELDVHWSVNFHDKPVNLVNELIGTPCEDIWIGFDAGRYGDKADVEAFQRFFDDLEMLEFIKKIRYPILARDDLFKHEVRTNEYMTEECKKLIDQLAV